ncbi:MAG: AAA domain-containing protein [Armatimonadota bacterium]
MPPVFLPLLPSSAPLRVSPTDISQFVRLEQCSRYLRLRLHQAQHGSRFLREYDVAPQAIPPLLTRSGRQFEREVEAALRARFRSVHFGEQREPLEREDDNAAIVRAAVELPPGEALLLLQPRLRVEVEGWLLTGDADLLRLERAEDGALQVLIADVKSSAHARVEHRLQVAFYHAMLGRLFASAGVAAEIGTALLFRGEEGGDDAALREETRRRFGWDGALLEVVADPEAYLDAVADLVTGAASTARGIASAPFEELSYHLSYKCDGCLYNELCLKWSAETDDLALIPHLAAGEKAALRRLGISTASELAALKEPAPAAPDAPRDWSLSPTPGQEGRCARAATTWPVGPRLDELIHRARRYRGWKGDPLEAPRSIPGSGYGSLPYCDAEQNPNLVRIYLDAQHDYLHDRLYLVGARVVACAGGEPARSRSVVHLSNGPPDTPERERALLAAWMRDTLLAVAELVEPAVDGTLSAPVHLVFYNSFEQRLFLEALSRHLSALLETAPALYDFMTQLAAFDSPIATFLDREIRELKNYPMVCQSLQAVAAHLGFDWAPFRETFRARLFDEWGTLDPEAEAWYTRRARFNSQIPLEYAYAAWGDLEPPAGKRDDYADYRAATPELIREFQERRLEALERIAADFRGNKLTEKRAFDLTALTQFRERAGSLAQALDEFVTIERHVELGEWKAIRHAAPERRVLMGETLLARFCPEDQDPEVLERNRENERRRLLKDRLYAEWRQQNPDAQKVKLAKEDRDACQWSQEGLRVRLRLETEGIDCSAEEILALTTLRRGERVVLNPRWTVDERLPEEDRQEFTPTPKQMLYGVRAELVEIQPERDAAGRITGAMLEVELQASRGNAAMKGFVFGSIERPLREGMAYSLDVSPDNWYGYWSKKVVEALCELERGAQTGRSAVYERLTPGAAASVAWPTEAAAGQARFLEGLEAFRTAGLFHDFEESKRAFIGRHGGDPVLLVQGPPGTGKSYSTAFALFARLQGAMAACQPLRALVSCKTHAATDVLLQNVVEVRERLRELRDQRRDLFDRYLDPRLLNVPLFRIDGREAPPEGVIPLAKETRREKGDPRPADALQDQQWCVAAATPGGIYGMVREKSPKALFDCALAECLVLDEASQMNLPEAVMAGLALRTDGQLIVVGDHRQMPPIVKHDWAAEPRRTFQEYRAYESLFLTLLPLSPPVIRFEESFRLHAEMAEFLRREVYQQDGIPYRSARRKQLEPRELADDFVAAVLAPDYPLVVVLHDERASQNRNAFERDLVEPVLEALSDAGLYALDAEEGLGIVVPHRAQRADLQLAYPFLTVAGKNGPPRSAVDTVERFQGGERTVIVVSATESDPEYLLASSKFLLDPRRLTVALSRAKQKLILVASRSVFSLFCPDEETFAHAQLWKNLLRRTCTEQLWSGDRDGVPVEVWARRG